MAMKEIIKHRYYGKTIGMALALSALMLVVTAGRQAYGQAGSATLSGTITDPTGAIIPGAKVTLIEEASKVQRTAVADKNGNINFIAIPPATYDLQIAAAGFRPVRKNGIAVHIGDQLNLPAIALTVAGNDVGVTVTAETGDIVPTTSGEQSYTLSSKQIQNLDIEGRSAIELFDLIPGAANTGNFTSTYNPAQAGFGQNASTYTVNGNPVMRVRYSSVMKSAVGPFGKQVLQNFEGSCPCKAKIGLANSPSGMPSSSSSCRNQRWRSPMPAAH